MPEYTSPFEVLINPHDPRSSNAGWWGWVGLREKYTETGDIEHLNKMLEFVTMDNPPDKQKRQQHGMTPDDKIDLIMTMVTAVFLAAILIGCVASILV